ncbi:MAG: zinc dependent phospholipase C family protein [Candidatus Hodarchaeota archaeon]
MKKLLKSGIFLMVMVLILAPTFTQAFNSAAHTFIAERVYKGCWQKIDLRYGSIAPDLALLEPWNGAYEDTHLIYADLRSYVWRWSSAQRAFAKGWWTHGIADSYADEYIYSKIVENPDFLAAIAAVLDGDVGDAVKLAHYAIEKALDVLLKDEYPGLALNLLNAVLLRSWQDRSLLVKVFVWEAGRTDWLTMVETESAFRHLDCRYAVALALSSLSDVTPLAELGEQLASEWYDIDISADDLADILNAAIVLCGEDYEAAIESTIEEIRLALGL